MQSRLSDVGYRTKFVGEEIIKQVRAAGKPVEWVNTPGGKNLFDPEADTVRVLTIPGFGYMPHRDFDIHEEAKLLYVAMTRAMDKLLLTCSKASPFVYRIQQVSQTARPPSGQGLMSGLMGLLGR